MVGERMDQRDANPHKWSIARYVHITRRVLMLADVLDSISYHPSTPPKPTTTSIHLSLTLPARSELVLTIPFTKLMLKYTEHRPDAERGREISSGVLTLLDLVGADTDLSPDVFKSDRTRIYTPRLLLDVPTPDFSMPYNVIIMSSTVMAVFFGMMHGSLTRRWGWVQLPKAVGKAAAEGKME